MDPTRGRAAAPGHAVAVRELVVDDLTRAQVRRPTAIGRRIVGTAGADLPAEPNLWLSGILSG